MSFIIKPYSAYAEAEVLALYESVGWTNYTRDPAMLRRAWKGSLAGLGAYDGGRLIGLVRAVGDGASVLLVQDLLVLPERQRKGVGTALMRAMLERFDTVYQTFLMTDDTPEHDAFYRSACAPSSEWHNKSGPAFADPLFLICYHFVNSS